ncbi:other/AgaK1 protein kinase [Coprinopsis cinerea okayama7|uniref:Other/AgaK1 protein kinase n=1 Tax=Coprinopsis cinerea (strain Okayama-7 / 130 / ATCC MYA-4618 / FGSC 9003) TaxID=240176 RepID=D6RN79_COPC7|nr:other/AgaK1 protein kinase [Coprinopsis cinerea okayama7\|eukprot:XP_002911049.1 other/AgaK1 protein kinase [Coprinopsis cinerea okayama7\
MKPLVVPFAYPDPNGNAYSCEELEERALRRYCFWDAPTTVEWFQARGYTLYKRFSLDPKDQTSPDPSWTAPRIESRCESNGQYPYAFYDNFKMEEDEPDLAAVEESGSVVFAQDQQGHQVAIKLVPNDSDEIRIYRLIYAQDIETLKERCILPVLNILSSTTHSFVVMPRWGAYPIDPALASLSELVEFIHCLLKGLVFLHKNNIAHRDISFRNIVMNHFSSQPSMYANEARRKLRGDKLASYAIIDYNISVIAPEGVERSKFLLPAELSRDSANGVPDTEQGELDYDPFAWDVGTLGAILSTQYQYFCGDLPLLAPLLDSMTTRDVSRRFTAAQALEFFETEVSLLDKDALLTPIRMPNYRKHHEVYDRWKDIPEPLAIKWRDYRCAKITRWTYFLRWMCVGNGRGEKLVMTIRRAARLVFWLLEPDRQRLL